MAVSTIVDTVSIWKCLFAWNLESFLELYCISTLMAFSKKCWKLVLSEGISLL